MDWTDLGKSLFLIGLALVILGGGLVLLGKTSGSGDAFGWLGRLPGDILIKRDQFTFYFPLATGLLVSLVVSLLCIYSLAGRELDVRWIVVLISLWGGATEAALASTSVRVLLFQDVPRLHLSGATSFSLRAMNGEVRAMTGPIVMTAAPGGVELNQDLVAHGRVTVQASQGDLSVKNGEASPLVVGGSLHVLRRDKGLTVINEVDLEEYVKGVVPSEMNAAWPAESLKAQAVLARTYVLYQRSINPGREYDVVAGIQDQVYRGREGVDERIHQAVDTTRGIIMTYGETPALAAFFSTAAGPTEDAMFVWSKDLPYLKGVDCPFDVDSPHFQWRAVFKIQDLETNLRRQGIAVGTIATLAPLSYSRSGRVAKLRILHSGGELVLRGEDLRRAVGYTAIPSTQFTVESLGRDVVLSGQGAGHGVGLCQWGAKELGGLGYPFHAILGYYFPGTELKYWR